MGFHGERGGEEDEGIMLSEGVDGACASTMVGCSAADDVVGAIVDR
jgi:hypothetical protein